MRRRPFSKAGRWRGTWKADIGFEVCDSLVLEEIFQPTFVQRLRSDIHRLPLGDSSTFFRHFFCVVESRCKRRTVGGRLDVDFVVQDRFDHRNRLPVFE